MEKSALLSPPSLPPPHPTFISLSLSLPCFLLPLLSCLAWHTKKNKFSVSPISCLQSFLFYGETNKTFPSFSFKQSAICESQFLLESDRLSSPLPSPKQFILSRFFFFSALPRHYRNVWRPWKDPLAIIPNTGSTSGGIQLSFISGIRSLCWYHGWHGDTRNEKCVPCLVSNSSYPETPGYLREPVQAARSPCCFSEQQLELQSSFPRLFEKRTCIQKRPLGVRGPSCLLFLMITFSI